jgi:hypothetical protein
MKIYSMYANVLHVVYFDNSNIYSNIIFDCVPIFISHISVKAAHCELCSSRIL